MPATTIAMRDGNNNIVNVAAFIDDDSIVSFAHVLFDPSAGEPITVGGTAGISAADGAIVALGGRGDVVVTDPALAASLTALAKGILTHTASMKRSATSVSTNVVSVLTTSTVLLNANAARLGGSIVNDSTSILYIKLSAGASATSYDYPLPGKGSGVPAVFEMPRGFTGVIHGSWVAADGAARVSERT